MSAVETFGVVIYFTPGDWIAIGIWSLSVVCIYDFVFPYVVRACRAYCRFVLGARRNG